MSNPYINLPTDKNQNPMQEYPAPYTAKARYGSNNVSVSSVVTLTDNTSVVEITAPTGAVSMRWVATTDTQASVVASGATANFDHVIASGQTRRFAVPTESQGTSSIVGINKQAGLYNRLAWVSTGATASVFGSEF